MKLPSKVVLHVGLEKAASTTIQNFLESHYDQVLAQGVLFPRSVFTRKVVNEPDRTSGHLELVRNLVDGDISAFAAEVENVPAERLLLSAENLFHYGDIEHLQLLADLLSDSELTLVVVLRQQDAWLQSYYVESVTNGWNAESGSIDRFAARLLSEGKLEYAGLLSKMLAIFAPDDVKVLRYEALSQGRGVIANFCDAVGISFSDDDYSAAPRSHVTRTFPEALEAHRRLNLLTAGFWSAQMHDWAKAQREYAHAFGSSKLGLGRTLLPSVAQRREVAAQVWASNDTVSREYLNGDAFGVDGQWVSRPETEWDEDLVQQLWDVGLRRFLDVRENAPAMRVKPDLHHTFPLPLLLEAEAALRVNEVASLAKVILSYSAGATALMAAARPNRLVYCVTRSDRWTVDLQQRVDQLDLPTTPVVYHPAATQNDYVAGIWAEPFFRQPDLVLIDGAFRACCLLAVALHTSDEVIVLFDEYTHCKERVELDVMFMPESTHGDMAEFRLQPVTDDAMRHRLQALLHRLLREDV